MGKVNVASLLRPSTFPLPQLMSALVYSMLDRIVTRKASVAVSTSTSQVFEMVSDLFIKKSPDSCKM